MKMRAENEKDVKFNALSKCELLVNDRCLERRIFVMKSVTEHECVSVAIIKEHFLHYNPFQSSSYFIIINTLTVQESFHAPGRSP